MEPRDNDVNATGEPANEMASGTQTLARRGAVYLVGVAILALGVSFSRRAGLGLSMLVAWPAVLADIDPSEARNMGWWVGAVFVLFVVLEVLILRREFKPLQFLQVPISLMYGSLVNLWNTATSAIPVPNYLAQLILTFLSVVTMAVGISIYLAADVVPLSSEGLVLAITQTTKKPFPRVKQAFDLSLIALALITSVAFLHEVRYVREGTVVSALLLGPLIGVANKLIRPFVYRVAHGHAEVGD